MNYNYEERKYKIVMWIMAILLVLSVAGVSLFFAIRLRTPSTRFNTVNVGARIARGRGFKSNLTNASVWDGTSYDNDLAGSGTEDDPYLITSAAEFYGFAKIIQSGTNYSGEYVSLTTDIDLNNKPWYPISWVAFSNSANYKDSSYKQSHSFHGTFLGNGHTITNYVFETPVYGTTSTSSMTGSALFGYLTLLSGEKVTIKDLNIDIVLSDKTISKHCAGLFSVVECESGSSILTLENINVNYIISGTANLTFLQQKYDYSTNGLSVLYSNTFGGLVGIGWINNNYNTCQSIIITNCDITYSGKIVFNSGYLPYSSEKYVTYIGGLAGCLAGSVKNCNISGFEVEFATVNQRTSNAAVAGCVGYAQPAKFEGNCVNASLSLQKNSIPVVTNHQYLGGIVARGTSVVCVNNYVEADIQSQSLQCVSIGGLVGEASLELAHDNLVQGNIGYYSSALESNSDLNYIGSIGKVSLSSDKCNITGFWTTGLDYLGGLTGRVGIYNNICNASIQDLGGNLYNVVGGLTVDTGSGEYSAQGNNIYNSANYSVRESTYKNYTDGETSDANVKLASTYADWIDFDNYWVINPKINNGYPMLKQFGDIAKVTGFDGSGTEANPYLIKTYQDLSGMASYYNDNTVFEQSNIYWQLANDIDVSVDANGLPIHFTPICYNKEFDGYFDGNSKTISGLLIDNQYEYAGLFGTIASSHWVKDLTVTGNVYWDEAYAVGGVAGRVMAEGYLQNCRFEGDIIGVLNTKTSTETNGVVGRNEINGAIDCTAQYIDLKYAKIGGTADAPTYTYYLYDWAQMTTSLYNRKVA